MLCDLCAGSNQSLYYWGQRKKYIKSKLRSQQDPIEGGKEKKGKETYVQS